MTTTIDLIQWINSRYGTNHTDEDISPVRDFTLLWNIFEREVCDRSFRIEIVRRLINENNIQYENFRENYEYFFNRYVTNGQTNERFNSLNLRENDRPQFVQETLLDPNSNESHKILTCIIIVYRLRNNLFHGNKYIETINNQKENLINAINILVSFLNLI